MSNDDVLPGSGLVQLSGGQVTLRTVTKKFLLIIRFQWRSFNCFINVEVRGLIKYLDSKRIEYFRRIFFFAFVLVQPGKFCLMVSILL